MAPVFRRLEALGIPATGDTAEAPAARVDELRERVVRVAEEMRRVWRRLRRTRVA